MEGRDQLDDVKEKIFGSILDSHIDLSCCQLGREPYDHLPSELRHCVNLTSLDLAWNDFETLPAELFELPHLQILNMNHNQLTTVNGIEELVSSKLIKTLSFLYKLMSLIYYFKRNN